jgi:hypothetical protein
VVAISATLLQQVYITEPGQDIAAYFQTRPPDEILGQTIYLFSLTPSDVTLPATRPIASP